MMVEIFAQTTIIGLAVIIINLIPFIFKKYKYLLLTATLSLILMYLGIYF